MSGSPLSILNVGLVTSVGLSAEASCAAIRAAITNHTETAFLDSAGERIVGAQVPLEQPWRGVAKLVKMLALAIEECLAPLAGVERLNVPLLLCLAESERPGRLDGIDEEVFRGIEHETSIA